MRIVIDFSEHVRGYYVYNVDKADLPKEFFELSGYEQIYWLDDAGYAGDRNVDRGDYDFVQAYRG